APHHRIRALHVLGEPAAHEGERAGIGRLRLAARGPAGGEGAVDGVRWHVVVFLFAHAELASLAGSAGRADRATPGRACGPLRVRVVALPASLLAGYGEGATKKRAEKARFFRRWLPSAFSVWRTGTSGGPWPCRTSLARPCGCRG